MSVCCESYAKLESTCLFMLINLPNVTEREDITFTTCRF